VFKQVFSGKPGAANVAAYNVARHSSIINSMVPTQQKKLKMANLQNSITSSMLVRYSEPKNKKIISQRVKVSEETHIIKPSSISFID
jgi:hypothetical protein